MGNRQVLISDLDGTLLGSPAALDRFWRWRTTHADEYRLVYATGRTLASVRALVAEGRLPAPDAVISSVGTEIHDPEGRPWPGWADRFDEWNADHVRDLLAGIDGLELQPAWAQSRVKASFFAADLRRSDLARLRWQLDAAGLGATLVYSGDRYLDVLPDRSGKGDAAAVITADWGVPPGDVLVFGDSGNDLQLFERGFRGTVVANALPELEQAVGPEHYRSGFAYADGVLDGIRHWTAAARINQTVPAPPPPDPGQPEPRRRPRAVLPAR